MDESNGNIKQSVFYQEMKELRGDISELKVLLEQHKGAMVQGTQERKSLRDALDLLTNWKDEIDDRVAILESKDKRVIAMWGAIGVFGGALITGIVQIIIASI